MQFNNMGFFLLFCAISSTMRFAEGRAIKITYELQELFPTQTKDDLYKVQSTAKSTTDTKHEVARSLRTEVESPKETYESLKGTQIVREERSPAYSPFGRAEGEASAPRRRARSPAYSPFGRAEGEASAPRRRARSSLETPDETHKSIKGTQIVREERSPAYSPFGRAEGEASAPRRRARSPAYSPFGRAEGEASAPRRRARSPAYSPFGRAEGEASAPRRRARSSLETPDETHKSIKGTQIVREERSPAYSPFGRAEGEASAPRRKA